MAKAAEWKVITGGPTVKLMEEVGRELTIDPETAIAKQTMKDVLVVIQDTGSARRKSFAFGLRISTGVTV